MVAAAAGMRAVEKALSMRAVAVVVIVILSEELSMRGLRVEGYSIWVKTPAIVRKKLFQCDIVIVEIGRGD